jgi:hypothetical protein
MNAPYTEEEIIASLAQLEPEILKGLVNGSWRLPGMDLPSGPNSWESLELLKGFLLTHASQFFTEQDAIWMKSLADPKRLDYSGYIMGAAQLNPKEGVTWLKVAIEQEGLQDQRTRLLFALSQTEDIDTHYILDKYYKEKIPEYNAGGLQEEFIKRLADKGDARSKATLAALIRDERFVGLGWVATRTFAEHIPLLLGVMPPEAKKYLALKHPLGYYGFEQRPALRKNYPTETNAILIASQEFQQFLQKKVKATTP